jgi:hypothetical protein
MTREAVTGKTVLGPFSFDGTVNKHSNVKRIICATGGNQ